MENNWRQNQFTLEELVQFNGNMGNPAYVAVQGVVYDVSGVPEWEAATHFGLMAGKDLSGEFFSCHRENIVILERLPIVGMLVRGKTK
ncbi:MAG: cytochrome b5 domain-containing protein [Desulfitobacteriaceae bacterium]|nr:cytochrome b5 domain-containing protein [Desulfitobacteriaceae bacterium]MDD4752851.1 cytochrome b5 domain-containing protein [Desulfitobacteriaceae bacterium]